MIPFSEGGPSSRENGNKPIINPEGKVEAKEFAEEEEKKKKLKKHKTVTTIDSKGITIKRQKARFVAGDEKGEIVDLEENEKEDK